MAVDDVVGKVAAAGQRVTGDDDGAVERGDAVAAQRLEIDADVERPVGRERRRPRVVAEPQDDVVLVARHAHRGQRARLQRVEPAADDHQFNCWITIDSNDETVGVVVLPFSVHSDSTWQP